MVVPAGVYTYSEICGSRVSSFGDPAVPVDVYSWLLARLYRTWLGCPLGAAAAVATGRTPFPGTSPRPRSGDHGGGDRRGAVREGDVGEDETRGGPRRGGCGPGDV